MKDIMGIGKVQTMDSRELAELTGKRHKNVLQDIRKQLEAQEIGGLRYEHTYLDLQSKERPCFSLDYEQTMILLSGYSIPLRARVIKRWRELENLNKLEIPQTYSEALLEAGRLAAENEQLQIENRQRLETIVLQQPAVEFFDAVTGSKSAIEMGKVAKVLDEGIGRNKLFEVLRSRGVLMRNNMPYQKYVDIGYFRVIEQEYTVDGEIRINIKTLVYQKGVDFIRKILKQVIEKEV